MSFESIFLRCSVTVALLYAPALAQTPAFEVAAIKPSLPMAQALPMLMQGKLRVGVSIDSSRVDMAFVTLTDLIGEAFSLKPHQISGPDWLSMERFDIQAKLPGGAAEDQIPAMLRALLIDRFGLKTHMELRTLSAYALIAGKNGRKLKPSALPADPQPRVLNTLTPSAGGKLSSSAGPAGPVQMTIQPNGIQLVMLRTNLSGFASVLTSILGRPVVDHTGLSDYFEIPLDIPREDIQIVARALGMGGPPSISDSTADLGGSSMFSAVEQLGLHLDPRKEQIETLVVDHIEKSPTAN